MTDKQKAFVQEYLVDLNATQAALRAGYSADTAYSQGQRLLKNVETAREIQKAMDERSKRTEITADNVLKELWRTALADPNELVEVRRTCCRYCFGENNRYQFTPREYEECEAKNKSAKDKGEPEPWDLRGGIGWDPRREPNPDCPECFGEGNLYVHAKDSRLLSPEGRRLYAGVKQTQNGIEIKMLDQGAALVNVGKHLGMFTDKVEHSGNISNLTHEERVARLAAIAESGRAKRTGQPSVEPAD